MQTIAVLGLGKMGHAIAFRFIQCGFRVLIWNRTSSKAADLLDIGAIWLETPAEAGLHTKIIFSMVADDEASEMIWTGLEGAMKNMSENSFVIECSTLSLNHVKNLAKESALRKLIYIDCPVTGLPDAARAGKLTLLVGAEIKYLEQIKPVLDQISCMQRHFGPVGAGTSYKLMINLMGAVQIAALAEGITLAERLGLDREAMIAAIENSAAASPQVIRYARTMAEKKFSEQPVFSAGLRYKDARYAIELANSIGSRSMLGKTALSWFESASKKNSRIDEAAVINEMI
jgi:3-hydroxyisobutyrate dehydrogenase